MVTPSAIILPSCGKFGGSKLPQSQHWGYFPPRGGRQRPRLNRGIEGGPNGQSPYWHLDALSCALRFASPRRGSRYWQASDGTTGKRGVGCAAWKAQPSRDAACVAARWK
ncbi:hypothetical protein CSHISOI_04465 [Colletotrichum shisoi]|uniref:Uncharacterized protein n=1 Tax=Colletotrichum shisoi TaxID=2078593 RepID=A0A5Q4BUX9_9PEZI|nr:hypothetical protein CSHISOI_04465 [Colletotrichum shisoi]